MDTFSCQNVQKPEMEVRLAQKTRRFQVGSVFTPRTPRTLRTRGPGDRSTRGPRGPRRSAWQEEATDGCKTPIKHLQKSPLERPIRETFQNNETRATCWMRHILPAAADLKPETSRLNVPIMVLVFQPFSNNHEWNLKWFRLVLVL